MHTYTFHGSINPHGHCSNLSFVSTQWRYFSILKWLFPKGTCKPYTLTRGTFLSLMLTQDALVMQFWRSKQQLISNQSPSLFLLFHSFFTSLSCIDLAVNTLSGYGISRWGSNIRRGYLSIWLNSTMIIKNRREVKRCRTRRLGKKLKNVIYHR